MTSQNAAAAAAAAAAVASDTKKGKCIFCGYWTCRDLSWINDAFLFTGCDSDVGVKPYGYSLWRVVSGCRRHGYESNAKVILELFRERICVIVYGRGKSCGER